jgi:hypothetical protein
MYGGFRKFIAERFLLNTIYRKNLRMWWLPTVFAYVCIYIYKRWSNWYENL